MVFMADTDRIVFRVHWEELFSGLLILLYQMSIVQVVNDFLVQLLLHPMPCCRE
jgi:hypothetical protein